MFAVAAAGDGNYTYIKRSGKMKFTYGNFSREVDNMDVEVVKRYEKQLEDFYLRVASIDMKKAASGIYADICQAGNAMMDGFFGRGAAREMFGESQSVRKVMEAVCGLNGFMNDVSGVIATMKAVGI